MKKVMKKVLALVIAGLMTAAAVVSVGAGNILTDEDIPLQGGWMGDVFNDIPLLNIVNGAVNKNAKCPNCGESCRQYVNVVYGCVISTYVCPEHGVVAPAKPSPDVPSVPPTEDDESTTADYVIRTQTTRGGKIVLSSDKPIKEGDSRIVYITPNYGYICTAVYVNGYNVGAVEKLNLNYIRRDYKIVAFFKAVDTNRNNAVTIETTGKGSVTARLDSKNCGEVDSVLVKYKNTLILNFTPDKNYKIENVKINGVDMGAINSYSFSQLYYDVAVEVTYTWNNPYEDVFTHLEAVEYVTSNGIMGSPNQFINTDQFQGDKKVNNYLLCAFLAEMADEEDVLDTHKERMEWAKKMGIATEDLVVTKRPTYAETAEIVTNFIRIIEEENDITFTALKGITDVKEIARELGFYNSKTYETGILTRYDVAEICYAIAQLEVK